MLALLTAAAGLAVIGVAPAAAATITTGPVEYTIFVGDLADLPPAYAGRHVVDIGHVDGVDLVDDGGMLVLEIHDDSVSPSARRDPADTLIHVKPEAALVLPALPPAFAFLGEEGDTVWVLPEVQSENPDVVWLGWAYERLSPGIITGAPTMKLNAVSGPGEVHVWQSNPFGEPISVFHSDDGLPDSVTMGTHVHASWGFTATGLYTLTFEVTATSAAPDPVVPALSISGVADHYHPGDTVTLTAVQNPVTDLDHYHWFVKCPPAESWAVVPEAHTGAHSFAAAEELDGCQYRVTLYDEEHNELVTSAPVTIHVDDHDHEVPDLSQTITVTLDEAAGALVVSVDPDDRNVTMSDPVLAPSGDRWESSGALRPVTVTDTRTNTPGWSVSGQVSDFTAPGPKTFAGKYLGWDPEVTSQSAGQGAVAGPLVAPGFTSGNGIASPSTLGSAPSGSGLGTAVLGADLRLELPTATQAGTYDAVVTLTVV